MPGVLGPERVVSDVGAIATTGGGVRLRVDICFDRQLGRYICQELTVFRDPAEQGGPVTSEALRQVTVEHLIAFDLLVPDQDDEPILRELENLDGVEPWGKTAPAGVPGRGPNDRVLRWVAHFYRLGYAVAIGATKSVEESLGVPRSTAGRWVRLARDAGYLGPADSGKAGI